MKVKFLETRVVQDRRVGTEDEEKFEEGKVYDLPEASAQRWIQRGVAFRDFGEKAAKPKGSNKAEGDQGKATEPKASTKPEGGQAQAPAEETGA